MSEIHHNPICGIPWKNYGNKLASAHVSLALPSESPPVSQPHLLFTVQF